MDSLPLPRDWLHERRVEKKVARATTLNINATAMTIKLSLIASAGVVNSYRRTAGSLTLQPQAACPPLHPGF